MMSVIAFVASLMYSDDSAVVKSATEITATCSNFLLAICNDSTVNIPQLIPAKLLLVIHLLQQ